jgi:hypothetical protein
MQSSYTSITVYFKYFLKVNAVSVIYKKINLSEVIMKLVVLFCTALSLVFSEAQAVAVIEASGIIRRENQLLIVSDSQYNGYFSYELPQPLLEKGPLVIDSSRKDALKWIPLPKLSLARDFESIEVLADGRLVLLSEALSSIVDEDGYVLTCQAQMTMIGNRGLEGLAARPIGLGHSLLAMCWEGGHLKKSDMPKQMELKNYVLDPVIWIYDLPADASSLYVKEKHLQESVTLAVPQLEEDLFFRASDLVWNKDSQGDWGFIVLLTGHRPKADKVKFAGVSLLQRYNLEGVAIGDPIKLNEVLETKYQTLRWEGLAWYEDGKSLVLINDDDPEIGPPVAYILPLLNGW